LKVLRKVLAAVVPRQSRGFTLRKLRQRIP
jgi:hypothetical protein